MTFSHTVWAEQVSSSAELPDERLQARLTTIIVNTIEHPSASIPQATGERGPGQGHLPLLCQPACDRRHAAIGIHHRHRSAVLLRRTSCLWSRTRPR